VREKCDPVLLHTTPELTPDLSLSVGASKRALHVREAYPMNNRDLFDDVDHRAEGCAPVLSNPNALALGSTLQRGEET
jgi:hypothetical protein